MTNKPREAFKAYRVGAFESNANKWFRDRTFDFIIMHNAIIQVSSLPLVANKLAMNGVAYVEVNSPSHQTTEKILHKLQGQDIETYYINVKMGRKGKETCLLFLMRKK